MKFKYRGYTYPKLFQHEVIYKLWKKYNCPRGMHLWDEVASEKHFLQCDACGEIVYLYN